MATAWAIVCSTERPARPEAPHQHPRDPDGLFEWCPDVDSQLHNFRAEAEWWYRYQEGYRDRL